MFCCMDHSMVFLVRSVSSRRRCSASRRPTSSWPGHDALTISDDVLAWSIEASASSGRPTGMTKLTGTNRQPAPRITTERPEDDPPALRCGWLDRASSCESSMSTPERQTAAMRTGEVGDLGSLTQVMVATGTSPRRRPGRSPGRSADGRRRTGTTMVTCIDDRVRYMIASGGENVYPAEVENAPDEPSGVADAP